MTELKIVPLDPKAGQKKEVLDAINDLRKHAEDGEILDLCFSWSHRDGSLRTFYTATDDAHRRLAGVSRLLHRLHVAGDEEGEHV